MNTSDREGLVRRIAELLLEVMETINRGTPRWEPRPAITSALLTTAEAAEFARRTPATIRRWTKRGRLEQESGEGPALYTRAALERAIRVGRAPRTTEPSTPAKRAEAILRSVK